MLESWLVGQQFLFRKGLETIPFAGDAYFRRQQPQFVVFAGSAAQLLQLVSFLYNNGIAFCMRGAGTSYTGASVANRAETVSIVTTGLDAIQEVDELNKSVVCEPGVITQAVANACAENNLFYPPDPASYKVCTIGGNAATNAGGPHCFLYGVTSNYIPRLDVIIQGKAFSLGSRAEFACHISLKDIIIGNEGTLAVISRLYIAPIKAPPAHLDYLVEFTTCAHTVDFIHASISGGLLPSVMDMATKPVLPGGQECGAYIFLSFNGGDVYLDAVRARLAALLEPFAGSAGCTEVDDVWELRRKLVKKHVTYTISESGKPLYFLFDAVVPIAYLKPVLYYCFDLASKAGLPLMNTFHAGDGNIHPTVFYDQTSAADVEKLDAFLLQVLKKVVEYGGALTGEHGIGTEKKELFTALEQTETVAINKVVKRFFDPAGLANPDKCLASAADAEACMSRLLRYSKKYGLDSVQTAVQPVSGSFNIVELGAGDTLAEIRQMLEGMHKVLPYEPLICPGKPLSFYVRHNIPNLWAHLFNLRNLVTGGCVSYGGSELRIGKMTSKNVAGYNLGCLLYHQSFSPTAYYLKCFHPDLLEHLFSLFQIRVPTANARHLCATFRQTAVSVILHSDPGQADALMQVFVYRHKQALEDLGRAIEKCGGYVVEACPHNTTAPQTGFVYLISLEYQQVFDAIAEKISHLGYIYSDLQKVFAVNGEPAQQAALMDDLADLIADGSIASIRCLDTTTDRNEYVYLPDPLRSEIDLADQLIAQIMHAAYE